MSPDDELTGGDGLLRAIAAAGRRRRAARELADAEMHEGTYVDDEQDEDDEAVRLAAADASLPRTYGGGGFRVELALGPPARVTQVRGPPGAALDISGALVPVSSGAPAEVDLHAFPEDLAIVDAQGRRTRLRPVVKPDAEE